MFAATNSGILKSAEFRMSRFGNTTPTGTLYVAVYEFNSANQKPGKLLGGMEISASAFNSPLGANVSAYNVDLSASNGQLTAGQTYLLAITAQPDFGSSAVCWYVFPDAYPGMNSYYVYDDGRNNSVQAFIMSLILDDFE